MALTDKLSAIADAIRAKTGKTDSMTLDQMPTEIAGITGGGGGSSADVRYVTFMNGTEVLYKKPVAVGDDCVDVLTKGLISTPTKESTAQYNYGYLGWGASDNGAVDANILKNITEDKTVYAIYSAILRFYTITWLDDDGSILTTTQVAYGAVPSYTPTKTNFVFAGWTPTPTAVTGNASYTAMWTAQVGGNISGTLSWKIQNKALVISGTGAIPSYTKGSQPWYPYKEQFSSAVISSGVTSIGNYTFAGTNIVSVSIPNSVTYLGTESFSDCKNLESVTVPDSVTSGIAPFLGCSALKSATIGSGVTSMSQWFRGCGSLESLVIPIVSTGSTDYPLGYLFGETAYDNGQQVVQYYYSNSSGTATKKTYYFPKNLKRVTVTGTKGLQRYAFYNCTLESVEVQNNFFNYNCFENANIGSLKLGPALYWIYPEVFRNCTLGSVEFANSGWYVTTNSSATSGTNVDVTNSAQTITLLTSTYLTYHWKRNR